LPRPTPSDIGITHALARETTPSPTKRAGSLFHGMILSIFLSPRKHETTCEHASHGDRSPRRRGVDVPCGLCRLTGDFIRAMPAACGRRRISPTPPTTIVDRSAYIRNLELKQRLISCRVAAQTDHLRGLRCRTDPGDDRLMRRALLVIRDRVNLARTRQQRLALPRSRGRCCGPGTVLNEAVGRLRQRSMLLSYIIPRSSSRMPVRIT